MTEAGEPERVWTCFENVGDEEYVVGFVVDARKYSDPAQARAALEEAVDEIDRRGIPGEYETRYARPGEPPSDLPRWPEYKSRLDADRSQREKRTTWVTLKMTKTIST